MLVIILAALAPLVFAASSPSLAAKAAYHDCMRIPPKDRPYMLYLWWDPSWSKYELLTKVQQSLLSTKGAFCKPAKVAPWLMRVDLRESGHEKLLTVREKFAAIDFVFHNKKQYLEDTVYRKYYPAGFYDGKWSEYSYLDEKIKAGQIVDEANILVNPLVESPDGREVKALDELRRMMYTEVPILWGPFWFVRTSRQLDINNTVNGVGYYEWFGIKTRKDFFNIVVFDEQKAVERFLEWRAYVEDSGISEQERQIILFGAQSGKLWGTLDVFTQKGRGQPRRNLRRNEFFHNAERWIGKLPNGLPLNGLFAADGTVQDSAPDKIGTDTSSLNLTNDKRIHPNSCWNCHGLKKDYIAPFDDWVRRNIKRNKAILKDPDKYVEDELDSTYLRDIYRHVKRDQEDFAFVIAQLTSEDDKDPGMTVEQFTRFYMGAFYQYVKPKNGVTAELAASYIGVPKEALLAGLKAINSEEIRGASDLIAADYLLDPKKGVRMLAFEDSYQYLLAVGLGVNVPELIEKKKAFNTKEKK